LLKYYIGAYEKELLRLIFDELLLRTRDDAIIAPVSVPAIISNI
jgi:hypothetical protein